MNIVVLGLMFCDESLQEAYNYSKCGLQMAPHVFQYNMLYGFEQCHNVNVKVYNIPPIGSFPINYKKIISKQYIWKGNNKQIGYVNLPIIKHVQQRFLLEKYLEDEIMNEPQVNIVIYSLYEPFLTVVDRLKKKYPSINVCLIQTDAVPGREDMEKYMTRKNIRKGNRAVALAKSCDMFVLLTKHLRNTLEVKNRPNIIVECISDDVQKMSKTKNTQQRICLYTGSTDRIFGIEELVCAFQTMGNAELWICGTGDADEYLNKCNEEYSNIKYYGYVDKNKVAELRDLCDYLINPRRPSGTYTKYSFPSKTVEYLMSGKPCIMYKLEGIPDEYDQYVNYLTGENAEEIKKELIHIFNKDYKMLLNNALEARRFVQENKSSKAQALRIIELLEKGKRKDAKL